MPLALIRLATVLLASLCALPARSTDPFERFDLPGGVQLLVWHVEDAPRQSTFTFLPLGLGSDAKQCAQYSHLVEHMIIRSTDPGALQTEGIQFNGETSAGALRIESYAEPARWKAALDRHLRWWQLDEVDAEVLEREKGRIQMEEQTTVAGGYTHKWAEAAWNQIVRHGLKHASVHGDVAQASPEQILAYAQAALARHDEVVVASVGPVDPAEIRDWLRGKMKAVVAEPREDSSRAAKSARVLKRAPEQATWDLDSHHYLEWIRLPDRGARQWVAGQAIAQLVNMGLYGDKSLPPGKSLASVMVIPEGRYLLFSVNLAGETQVAAASASFRSALAKVAKGGAISLPMALMQLKYQANQELDPTSARKQLRSMKRDVSLVEAQLLLTAVMNEWQLGLTYDEIQSAWTQIDLKWLESYIMEVHKQGKPSGLLLQPQ